MNRGVIPENKKLRRVLILADESADWEIAGLRQLDRILLSLNEFAAKQMQGGRMTVCVFWKGAVNADRSQLPRDRDFAHLEVTDDAERFWQSDAPIDLVLTTRLFLYRDALPRLGELAVSLDFDASQSKVFFPPSFNEMLQAAVAKQDHLAVCEYVADAGEIANCERRLLSRSGKSQDGLVSRYFNRPFSRLITHLLLKLPVKPNTWSLLIFIFPLAGSFALLQGTYSGFVIGTILYQIYSMLDGCDGEIARAKFLETEKGRHLDNACDVLGNLLLVTSLGYGLFRQASSAGSSGAFFLIEGFATAVLIATNEYLLATRKSDGGAQKTTLLGGALYPRHRGLVELSGALLLGEKFAWWIIQLTKRDVALLAFVVLALLGRPEWILHSFAVVTAISLILTGQVFARARSRATSASSV